MKASYLFQNLKFSIRLQARWIHPKAKFKLKDDVEQSIVTEKIKPRHHPGIIKRSMVELPQWTLEAMSQSLDDADKAQIFKESKELANYLFSRRLPPEDHDIKKKFTEVEDKLLEQKLQNVSNLTEEEIEEHRKSIRGKVIKKVESQLFAWKALEYNGYRSLMYMIARSAAEYAVLFRIFQEIKIRDPDFKPQTMFDYGSGVGSVVWAAQTHWKNSLTEYIGIDMSNDMNDLSEKIMTHSPWKIKGFYHRQYLPISNLKHDIVVSAYSLLDLPNMKLRLQTVAKLWKKTNKYLIIVEQGTNAGFRAIHEAQSFIHHVMKNLDTETNYFTFAPCPHERRCPRYSKFDTPCNFIVRHATLPLLGPSYPKQELYSYIVFKKGSEKTEEDSWYRLVRPTIIRSKHARCRTCTPEGKLEEIVFTSKKHGKSCYRCAKASRWGDRLPIDPVTPQSMQENLNEATSADSDHLENEEESDSDESEMEEDFNDEMESVNQEEKIVLKAEEEMFVSKSPFKK